MNITESAILVIVGLLLILILLVSFREPKSTEQPVCLRGQHPETHGCRYF